MIGSRVRIIRQQKNISQAELALRLGFKQCQVSKVENNTRKIRAEELPCFAQALGVTVNDLLEEQKAC